MPRLLITYLDG